MPRMPRDIFTPEWQAAGAASVDTAMPAKVRIYRIDTEDSVYDPETNTYVFATETLYGGEPGAKARIQPLRGSRYEIAPMDSQFVQAVLVSVPIATSQGVDFKVSDRVLVLESALNTINTAYQYVVNEILDSSNPLERTLLCSVILETRVVD